MTALLTTPVRRALSLLLVVGAALTLASCGTTSPQAWLDENMTKVSGSDPETGVYYSSTKPVADTLQQVSAGTKPDDSMFSGGTNFMRYGSDYMVVIPAAAAAAAGASAAELWTFNAGYARYGAQVAAWDEFRGGGSGEGK